MLYSKLVKQVHSYDPNFDVEHIDRSLEYGEAKSELARKHGIHLGAKREKPMSEYRGYLSDKGIGMPRVQSLVIAMDKPLDDAETDYLAYLLSMRSKRSWAVDRAKRAKHVTRDVRKWSKAPNRYDIAGLDTPGSTWRFWE